MTREQYISERMTTAPLLRHAVNGQIVEMSGAELENYYGDIFDSIAAAESTPAYQRQKARADLRAQWEALPAYIRGPYRDKFEAANRLLDEGDDAAAVALIEYAAPVPDFDAAQLATFAQVKASMKAGIEALP